jgi:hypothetical protein
VELSEADVVTMQVISALWECVSPWAWDGSYRVGQEGCAGSSKVILPHETLDGELDLRRAPGIPVTSKRMRQADKTAIAGGYAPVPLPDGKDLAARQVVLEEASVPHNGPCAPVVVAFVRLNHYVGKYLSHT